MDRQRTSMKIYAFTENYPSPYKPYHDTQFEQFIKDGHSLKLFSFDQHEGDLNPVVRELELDKLVVNMAATARSIPSAVPAVTGRMLSSPIATLQRIVRAGGTSAAVKHRVLHALRAAVLPDEPPDVCVVHNLLTQLRLGFLKRVYPHAPIVFYYHGGEVPGVPQVPDREAAMAFAGADVVFTNTENSREHAIKRGCAPSKIFVSPVGFNLSDFPEPKHRTYKANGSLQVLTVGRLSEEKGLNFALEAFARLHDQGRSIRYRIVGDGPQASRLREYVAQRGLTGTVEFVGRLSREKLFDAYAAADVFLLPSVVRGTWQENQACVVQEAMFAKTVVAISRTGGVPESTAPEMLPFSFEPENPEQIAQALLRLDELSATELTRLGQSGREFTERRYDIRTLNRELLNTVKRVAG